MSFIGVMLVSFVTGVALGALLYYHRRGKKLEREAKERIEAMKKE